jgi:hypothetical protein
MSPKIAFRDKTTALQRRVAVATCRPISRGPDFPLSALNPPDDAMAEK